MNIMEILKKARDNKGSDVHITVGVAPIIRINGALMAASKEILTKKDTEEFVRGILEQKQFDTLEKVGEVDCSFEADGVGRFRVNAFKQRGCYAVVMRLISEIIPSLEELGMPDVFYTLANKRRGLILVTGPTGSGKSTTLAAMIDYINKNKNEHIVTIEDPIEYVHKHHRSIVNQREVGYDTNNFAAALRASLREDPDIILVGEMRDLETISTAITAAETGHLVLSTLHTIGADKTVDRIIDVFPPGQQQHIRTQLAMVLEGVVSQQLLPRSDTRGRIAVHEVMLANGAIRNLIREGKTHQIPTVMMTNGEVGMTTMDSGLISTYREGKISREDALKYSVDFNAVSKEIG